MTNAAILHLRRVHAAVRTWIQCFDFDHECQKEEKKELLEEKVSSRVYSRLIRGGEDGEGNLSQKNPKRKKEKTRRERRRERKLRKKVL